MLKQWWHFITGHVTEHAVLQISQIPVLWVDRQDSRCSEERKDQHALNEATDRSWLILSVLSFITWYYLFQQQFWIIICVIQGISPANPAVLVNNSFVKYTHTQYPNFFTDTRWNAAGFPSAQKCSECIPAGKRDVCIVYCTSLLPPSPSVEVNKTLLGTILAEQPRTTIAPKPEKVHQGHESFPVSFKGLTACTTT